MLYKELQEGEHVLLFATSNTLKRFPPVENALLLHANVRLYPHIEPNPQHEAVMNACGELEGHGYDHIIAWGGGSVIDFAKAFRHYSKRSAPLIAIPTTAGTGSEATQFAVIYKDGVKQSIDEPGLLPECVILDSQFCENAPRHLKACCAMDAYCQAIESYWARRATEESRGYALKALKLCRECLVQAVNGNDPVANEQMLAASHFAGKAINISRTTAAHALSYKLTTGYGIPHGHAVALCLPSLFPLNVRELDDPKPMLDALGISDTDAFPERFRNLMRTLGLETRLRVLGVSDPFAIVDSVNLQRLANNPRDLTREDMLHILST